MRIAGALVSAGHLACGVTGWLAFELPGALLLFGICAALSLALALIASPLMQRPGEAADGDGAAILRSRKTRRTADRAA